MHGDAVQLADQGKAPTVDAGYIEKLEANYPGRMLPIMPATHSVRDFLLAGFNGSVSPRHSDIAGRWPVKSPRLGGERVGEKAA